jgi:hypothetical protein
MIHHAGIVKLDGKWLPPSVVRLIGRHRRSCAGWGRGRQFPGGKASL